MTDARMRNPFARYMVAGLVNTAATYSLLVMASHWVDYRIAYSVAYAFGVGIGYWLQSRFVFGVPFAWSKALRFPLAYIAQYVVGLALIVLLVKAGISPGMAASIAVVATVPLGFLLGRTLLRDRVRANPFGD